ncbi:UNKNOWN [Stylonychia lemnae]|uniref:Uncharacterized protein n=1 Tax=Stylonychia lemnae TaxID=5949 RepID=A0A078B567_STYLE|nr:UNKNOWN [Stylonychia lemnae]|eukprot:CDW89670.1 UNKNOWN [Stylonychia lemnae]
MQSVQASDTLLSILVQLHAIYLFIDKTAAYFGIASSLFSTFLVLRDPNDYATNPKFTNTLLAIQNIGNTFHLVSVILMAVMYSCIEFLMLYVGVNQVTLIVWTFLLGFRTLANLLSGYLPNVLTLNYLDELI